MIRAGDTPGAGSYECDLCGEIVRLTDRQAVLEPCKYCKTTEYLEVVCGASGETITQRLYPFEL